MNLTIEQLSKLTKLSVPTLRVYVTRRKLGRKVGKRRVFQVDVQKLLKTSKGSNGNMKAKAKTSRVKPSKDTLVSKQDKKLKVVQPKIESPKLEPKRKGFWSSIFGARKPKEKVNLLEAKTRK